MAKKAEQVVPEIIDSVEGLNAKMAAMREAQKVFATYTQEQVDKIFFAAASAANKMRIPLAKMAVEETGMGIVEDKVIKNNYAAEYIYNAYKNTKTVGVIEEDKEYGIKKIAEPIGLVAAVIPTTNPTSTAIFKTLISLKTRNAIIISPHPRAKKSTIAAAKVVLDAAVAAGAPEGIIGWIDVPSLDLTNEVMRDADIILATGGPGMVKAAYSSGKPALGVGAGNTPVIIDDTADVRMAVNSIIHSKTFDNGMICASEQSVTILEPVYEAAKKEFEYRGCYFLKLGASGMQVLVWAMVNDAIDYHELQTGERNEGIVYSTYSFFRKLASAISGSLSSFVLGAIGYNVTAGAVQTAGVVNAIWKSYTGIYFLGYGIAVAILFFVYPLTKQKTAEMLTELKARRAAKESK